MGSFFCDLLSFDHDVAIYDYDPKRLRFTYNARRFSELGEEVREFAPELVINAATVKYTLQAFEAVLPWLPPTTILSDIASVKTGLPEFYERAGYVENLNGTEGSVTIIGAVSPQGSDFSEPVSALFFPAWRQPWQC